VTRAVPDFFKNLGSLARSPYDWWASLTAKERGPIVFFRFAIVVALALVVGWAIRRALLHWFGRDPAIEAPTYARRLTGAIADGLAHGIVPALILGGFIARALSDQTIISGLFRDVFVTFCGVTVMFVLARALPRAVLAPDLPAWRLISVTPENARRISHRISFLAAVFAVDLFLSVSSESLVVSSELNSLYTLIANTLEAMAILTLIQRGLWAPVEEAPAEPEAKPGAPALGRLNFWTTIRRLSGLIAVAIVLTALAGYANLSRYLTESLVISGMVLGALVLLRGLLRELVGVLLRSRLFQETLSLPHKTRSRYKFWLRSGLDLAIYGGGLAVLLIVWGVAPNDLLRWLAQALQGFTIGNVTISISDILVAVAVFVVTMTVTRGLQRVLNERVFPQTELDTGVQNSLSAGLGYLGLGIAAALAVSAIGLDLSNIAIIAGALSVGIGFGLQNIVNNFVSGLILLVERPIKVDDWIVVGGNEGYVKRINVRATELETFQRASVIVPNSELLSSAVINWTHKDRYGRVEVPVGVAYGSDIGRVMQILQDCLKANEDILPFPEPFVLFQGFGDSSLDFEARGYIGNVAYRVIVASNLRVAIYRAFEEAGIEIPFPQRDLHIKSMDDLESKLAQAAKPQAEPKAPMPASASQLPSGAGDG
jgi:potassium efflux system protein